MQFRNLKNGLFAALLFALSHTAISAEEKGGYDTVYLNQNWNDDQRQSFYYTPQGSYLLPYSWFLALEQPDNGEPFTNRKNIERLGYLVDVDAYHPNNPDGLPIGFAKEPVEGGEAWVGMTCAACHTGEVHYRGNRIRVDGAPTLGDFTALERRLIQSLKATLEKPEKFERFAQAVLGSVDTTKSGTGNAVVPPAMPTGMSALDPI